MASKANDEKQRTIAKNMIYQLNSMTDYQFLDFVLDNGDAERMNGFKFPGYEVAQKVYDNNWTLSQKQRHAITNVYVTSKTDVSMNDLGL